MTTLPALKARYYAARRAMIEAKAAQGMTQTQAARELGVTLQALNNEIMRNNIAWIVTRQGEKTCKT